MKYFSFSSRLIENHDPEPSPLNHWANSELFFGFSGSGNVPFNLLLSDIETGQNGELVSIFGRTTLFSNEFTLFIGVGVSVTKYFILNVVHHESFHAIRALFTNREQLQLLYLNGSFSLI
ncbi:MAG: hypothetical protein WC384_10735 [Prolixibacteraceae bacterium]